MLVIVAFIVALIVAFIVALIVAFIVARGIWNSSSEWFDDRHRSIRDAYS